MVESGLKFSARAWGFKPLQGALSPSPRTVSELGSAQPPPNRPFTGGYIKAQREGRGLKSRSKSLLDSKSTPRKPTTLFQETKSVLCINKKRSQEIPSIY